MKILSIPNLSLAVTFAVLAADAFQPSSQFVARFRTHASTRGAFTSSSSTSTIRGTTDDNAAPEDATKNKRADVMSFLRKKGAVGKNQDFSTAMGVDEGPVGKNKNEGKFAS